MTERNYTVPLRRSWLNTPRYKRTKRAVSVLKQFIARHMKAEISEVKIGRHLNMEMWKHGIKNPPHKIKIHTKKEDNLVLAELEGKPFPVKEEAKKEGGLAEKLTGAVKKKTIPKKTAKKAKDAADGASTKETKPAPQAKEKSDKAEAKSQTAESKADEIPAKE